MNPLPQKIGYFMSIKYKNYYENLMDMDRH
jgi:hypothetical protein